MSRSVNPEHIRALLFDFGNVLINVRFQQALDHWQRQAGTIDAGRVNAYINGPAHHAFETGALSEHDFFAGLRTKCGIELDDTELAAGWNAVLAEEIPGIRVCLENCAAVLPLFLFSNTNSTHYRVWRVRYADLLRPFQAIFVSHILGLRKPEPTAFRLVAAHMGQQPEHILFFDDNNDNVTGARHSGMQAIAVQSLHDLTGPMQALEQRKA